MADKFTKKIKQLKVKDIIYPTITVLGFVIFMIIFILSIRFIFNSINQVFRSEEEYKIIKFDVDGFNKVAARLGIQQ